jgi:uncharacterized membrane protein
MKNNEVETMSENPYQAPLADLRAVGVKSGQREDVRAVAVYQKGILVCLAIYLLLVIGQFAVPADVRPILGLVFVSLGVAGLVFVFLLSTKVYSTAVGVILAVLTLLPCIGILVLLVVNSKATRILTDNGYKVGLLGAKLSDF